MKSCSKVLALLAIGAVASSACAEDGALSGVDDKSQDYSLSVQMEQPTYDPGQKVIAIVTVTNTTDHVIKLLLLRPYYRFTLTRDGVEIPAPMRWKRDSLIAKERERELKRDDHSFWPKSLKPGEKSEERFVTNIEADLSKEGKYQITAKVRVYELAPEEQPERTLTASTGFSIGK